MEEYRKYEPLFGDWYFSRLLGTGSFGKVYEIIRKDHGTVYKSALKIISMPQDDSDIKSLMSEGMDERSIADYYKDALKDVIRENEIMFRLKATSNIVSYEDHKVIPHDDGIGYDILIKMELLTPFIDCMIRGRLSRDEIVRLGIDMCKALELCHRNHIIHRDIKPQNIFVSDNGDYKLGDFGIARSVEKTIGALSKKGTYDYMAPEVFKGEEYDSTVDIYSLGIVLYTLLNNNRGPFLPPQPAEITSREKEAARIRRMKGERLPDPANADYMLSGIIQKACAYLPEDRFMNAGEMRKALEAYRDNYGAAAKSYVPEWGDDKTTIEPNHSTGNSWNGSNRRVVRTSDWSEKDNNGRKKDDGDWGRNKRNKRNKKLIYAFLVIIVALIAGISMKIIHDNRSELEEEGGLDIFSKTDIAEDLEVVNSDINFSQVENLDASPVDVLLKIANNGDKPVKSVDYSIKYNGELFENRVSGGTVFNAFGYIKPGEIGYLYSQITVPSDTPRTQGSISIEAAEECEDLGDYVMPYGSIAGYNQVPDTYDVEVYNPNDSDVSAGRAIVIAYIEGFDTLMDAWGCGVVSEPVAAGEKVILNDAIHDPGFAYTIYDKHYSVFVIDKDVIGID